MDELIRNLEHYVSRGAMDIVGLGIKIVAQLVSSGLVKDVADLYTLRKDDLLELEGFAEKKAENLLQAIGASRNQSLSRLITALGIRGVGASKAEAFVQAAKALVAVTAELSEIAAREAVAIECEEQDDELLFVSWLSALLYEMGTRGMLFSSFDVEMGEGKLRAKAWGEAIDAARHKPAVEVKAVTYADLRVEKEARGKWIAQCIVDV